MGAYIRVTRYTKNSIILSGMTILSRACNSESRETIQCAMCKKMERKRLILRGDRD